MNAENLTLGARIGTFAKRLCPRVERIDVTMQRQNFCVYFGSIGVAKAASMFCFYRHQSINTYARYRFFTAM